MKDSFRDRGIVIIGGAGGIGLATARLLRRRGARLALWDCNADGLRKAAAELGTVWSVVDVTEPGQVHEAAQQAARQLGSIDSVLHAAGIMRTGLFEQLDLETHHRILDVNLYGGMVVADAVLPYLRASHGYLLFMCSVASVVGPPEYTSYAASKAGLLNFVATLGAELEGTGVAVGCVCPNTVDTPMISGENRNARFIKRFGIIHTADDVAQVIASSIAARRYLAFPSWQPRLLFWLSRMIRPALARRITHFLWKA